MTGLWKRSRALRLHGKQKAGWREEGRGQGEGRVEMYIAETFKGEEGGTGRKRAGT